MLERRLLVFLEIEAQPAGGEAVEALRLFAEPSPKPFPEASVEQNLQNQG
jgi:hypothetical protein